MITEQPETNNTPELTPSDSPDTQNTPETGSEQPDELSSSASAPGGEADLESSEQPSEENSQGGRPRHPRFDERENLPQIKNIRNAERFALGRRRRIPIQEAVNFSEKVDCAGEELSEAAVGELRDFLKAFDVRALEQARERSKELGYAPFTHLGIRAYHWIQHNCPEWVLEFMKDGLENPEKIFPAWGCRFAATMADMGEEECDRAIEADCLYDLVTASPHWTKERRSPQDTRRGRGGPHRRGHQKGPGGGRHHKGRRGNQGQRKGPRKDTATQEASSQQSSSAEVPSNTVDDSTQTSAE